MFHALAQQSEPAAPPVRGAAEAEAPRAATPDRKLGQFLAGFLARGHGAEAICFFLSLTLGSLQDLLVEHDLPTPRDVRFRKGVGPRGWTSADYLVLLECWTTSWRAGDIAAKLGRSRSSIYYKARWLGLPKRDRRSLLQAGQLVPADAPPQAAPALSLIAGPEEMSWPVEVSNRRTKMHRKRDNEILWTDESLRFVADMKWSGLNNAEIAKICRVGAGPIKDVVHRLQIPRLAMRMRSTVYDAQAVQDNIAEMRYEEARDHKGVLYWRPRGSHAMSRRDKKRVAYICTY